MVHPYNILLQSLLKLNFVKFLVVQFYSTYYHLLVYSDITIILSLKNSHTQTMISLVNVPFLATQRSVILNPTSSIISSIDSIVITTTFFAKRRAC